MRCGEGGQVASKEDPTDTSPIQSNQHVVPGLVVMAVGKKYVLRETEGRLEIKQEGKRTEEQADFA